MAKRLEYDIVTDASKGIAGLKQFAGAAKKAMKDVDDSFDDTTTSAQKLAKVLSNLAGDMESEMKQAAAAADALSDALGPELAGRADITSIVADLNKMGLSFEEITADAETLAAALKDLDKVQTGDAAKRLGDIEGASKRASSGVDEIGKSADSSKSALANMVGNAAQDVGSLGGISGSAGVAIGQMAEYMADAAGSGEKLGSVLKSFALVAGPIALIAAAVEVATGVMAEFAERAEESDARVESFGESMSESADDALGLAGVLRDDADALRDFNTHASDFGGLFVENLNLVARQLPIIGGLLKEASADVVDIATKGNISFYDLAAAIEAGGLAGSEFNKRLLELADSGQITEAELEAMLQFMDEYGANARDAAKAQALFNVDLAEADAMLQEIVTKRAPLKKFTAQWNTLFEDLSDGTIDTKAAADAINFLADQLGVSPDEVISIALDDIADKSDLATTALETTIDAMKDWANAQQDAAKEAALFAVAVDDAQGSVNEMAGAFKIMERREGAIEAAFAIGNAPLKALEATQDVNDAIRDLGDFIRDEGVPNIFDRNDIDAGPFLDKIAALRDPIQAKIAEAFATGGPDAARRLADGYVTQITNSLRGKLSKKEVATLLGLGDLEATIQIAVDQESLATATGLLEVLTGIAGNDPWTAQIQLDLGAGEITADAAKVLIADRLKGLGIDVPTSLLPPSGSSMSTARADANTYMRDHPATMPTETAPPGNVGTTLRDTQRTLNQHPLTIPVALGGGKFRLANGQVVFDSGGTVGAIGGIAAERGPEIINRRFLAVGPTYVPPGTRVTSRRQTARILRTRGTRGLRAYDQGGVVAGGSVNVTVNAGVVGNRYDVMRAVRKAATDGARLMGTRG